VFFFLQPNFRFHDVPPAPTFFLSSPWRPSRSSAAPLPSKESLSTLPFPGRRSFYPSLQTFQYPLHTLFSIPKLFFFRHAGVSDSLPPLTLNLSTLSPFSFQVPPKTEKNGRPPASPPHDYPFFFPWHMTLVFLRFMTVSRKRIILKA